MGLQPGDIIDGKYRIIRLLGEGGMGAVYLAENTRIARQVAIKVLLGEAADKPDVVQRFEREAQAAGRIGSDHILEILDFGNLPNGDRFMVMEFLEGEELSARIKRSVLTPEQSVHLFLQLLEGLEAAHAAGIVHRDLKPDNIFILKEKAGRPDFVKIIDFGISKFNQLNDAEHSKTKTGMLMGTPYYLSPEQARGAARSDPRSDIYSCGVILYQCVTGTVPFDAETLNELLFAIVLSPPRPISEIAPHLDAGFRAIIDKAMARELNERFQTTREFKDALSAWAQGLGFPTQGAALGANASQGVAAMSPAAAALAVPQTPNLPLDTKANFTQSQDVEIPKRNLGLFLGLGAGALLVLGVGGVALALALRTEPPSAAAAQGSAASAASAQPEPAKPDEAKLPAEQAEHKDDEPKLKDDEPSSDDAPPADPKPADPKPADSKPVAKPAVKPAHVPVTPAPVATTGKPPTPPGPPATAKPPKPDFGY